MSPHIWTKRTRLLGNLIPLGLALPFVVVGAVQMSKARNPLAYEIVLWFVLAIAAGLLGVNFFGLYRNAAMKRAMERRLIQLGNKMDSRRHFVGFATAAYRDALDPHEDIGFLILEEKTLRFIGDSQTIEVGAKHIVKVILRPNIHSWLFLGGWVSVEGVLDGRPIRLLFEPRDRSTLIGNRRLRKGLKTEIERWLRAQITVPK